MGFAKYLKASGLETVPPERLKVFSALVYGESGAGKSTLAATSSLVDGMSPVLVIDAERHTMAYGEHADLENLDIVSVDTWADLLSIVRNVIPDAVKAGEFPYKTIVVDTMDRVQELIMEDEKREQAAGRKAKDGFAVWNRVYDDLSRLISRLQALGVNLILTAHADRTQNQITGEERVSPKFFGKVSVSQIPPKFDMVAYLKRIGSAEEGADDNPHLRALVTAHPDAETKAPTSGFPAVMYDPNMPKIYTLIINTTNEENSTDD